MKKSNTRRNYPQLIVSWRESLAATAPTTAHEELQAFVRYVINRAKSLRSKRSWQRLSLDSPKRTTAGGAAWERDGRQLHRKFGMWTLALSAAAPGPTNQLRPAL